MTTLLQQKWLSKLLDFDYEISYKKGKDNVVAHGLSRALQQEEETLKVLTINQPMWVLEILESYHQDPLVLSLIPGLVIDPTSNQEYNLQNGVLRKQEKIYQFFYWGSMNKEMVARVTECSVCQQYKSENMKNHGLLQPLPIPFVPWQDIAMDFIKGFPLSQGNEVRGEVLSSPKIRDFAYERNKIQSALKEALAQAQERMKYYADKNILEREFNVGD
ncbi:hypothetical protein EZV62_018083 [Acer yangbiense]|uniref:Integrase zinc-binding domain-containing protein n=1 Tax=Acer yangbiense TaxID=1000413 RepID=A0A5C7HIA8_9ROSI|nr:hypothetical protein EZV62_018083 [Acer yangbiense]